MKKKKTIAELFDEYPLTKAYFAERCGIHRSSLTHFTNEQRLPTDEQLMQIEDALHALGRELQDIQLTYKKPSHE